MKTRSSGVSQIAPDRWFWWAKEEWQEDGDRLTRERSGTEKTREDAQRAAQREVSRMEDAAVEKGK